MDHLQNLQVSFKIKVIIAKFGQDSRNLQQHEEMVLFLKKEEFTIESLLWIWQLYCNPL